MNITRRGFLAGTAAAALAPYVPARQAVPPPLRGKPLVEVTGWVLTQECHTREEDVGGPWLERVVTGYSWDVRSTMVVHQDAYRPVMARLEAAYGQAGTVRMSREASFGEFSFSGQALLRNVLVEFEPPIDPVTGLPLWDHKTIRVDFQGIDAGISQTLDGPTALPETPHALWLLEETARAERREGLLRALREPSDS